VKLSRRTFVHLTAGAPALPTTSLMVRAQAYPSRPVRIIVGFAAGGMTDVSARLIGQWLSERLKQPFIIENRPGAASNIAADAAVRASADGYTLLMAGTTNTVNATLYDNLNFNFIRDLAPVASVMRAPQVLDVNPSVPAKTVPEFIAYAKTNPRKLNMGSGGVGTPQHVAGELFKMMAGVDMIHVPYRGGAPALADLLGGHVQVMFDIMAESIEHIRAGKIRPLAVTTAARAEALPDLPTLSDFVPSFEASAWTGVCAPRATPADVIERLNKEINSALADPYVRARFDDLGATVLPGSPTDFGNLVANETEKWATVIKTANIKPE
jgi:tripartite-type tricarboxylate transporter receptor subunit TctC